MDDNSSTTVGLPIVVISI